MGKFYGGNFQAIQEYFQQKFCRFCSQPFSAEGIKLLREEPGMMVVRVGCCQCGRPLGVAIVGTGAKTDKNHGVKPADWTKRDWQKFANQPAISYDDVLDVHQFLSKVGSDWAKYLPHV